MTDKIAPRVQPGHAPLVLVADDDPGIGQLIAKVVQRLGGAPVVAGDGIVAVRLAAEHKLRLCCAILDVHMPRLGGIEAVREMRQFVPDLPIVLMSAAFPRDYEQRIAPLHIAHLLPKPFQLSELIALMGRFVAALPAV